MSGGAPMIRELEVKHDVADTGLQCRPGYIVERWNPDTEQNEQVPVNPDWWFPHNSDTTTRAFAQALCRRCPARERCFELGKETARHYGPAGVWGGVWFGSGDLSDREQRRRKAAS